MIGVLFCRELKKSWKLLALICAVLTLYMAMITSMFDPALGESLNTMMESMPQVFAAFGMSTPGTTLLDFLVNYLYGFLLVVFPMLFILILSNRLVARYTDRGSMAWLLASPHKRRELAVNQAVVLMAETLALTGYVTLCEIALSAALFPGELDLPAFLRVNLGLYGLILFLGGLSFCCSCLFGESRRAVGVSAGCCVAFVLVQMVSQVGEKYESLRYATPLTLFDPEGLAAGDGQALACLAVLCLTGAALFAAGIAGFCRKDISV